MHHSCAHDKLYYIPSLQKVVSIRFFLACATQYRVEHCNFTGFSNHTGIFSAMPGISCPFTICSERNQHSHQTDMQKSVTSCDNYANDRLKQHSQKEYAESSKSNLCCLCCTDWDLLSVRYVPHHEYPKDALNHNNATMKKAKLVAFEIIVSTMLLVNLLMHTFH